jgi:hypothetical protein
MTKLLTVLGLMAAVGVGSAEAGVNPRQVNERARIARNVRSGSLTWRETERLSAEQARIQREEWRYRHNDGHLGAWERADIARDQDRASRHIFDQAHDAQVR